MTENKLIYGKIIELIKEKNQLSISGITRELNKLGIIEHRLIITGYLRALRDLNIINEVTIKPAKIYIFKKDNKIINSLIE